MFWVVVWCIVQGGQMNHRQLSPNMEMLVVVVGILDREEEGCILGTQNWGL